MREIEFRAYIKNLKQMVEVKSIHLGTKKIIYGYSKDSQNYGNKSCNFEDCEIMQYTGLKDKNGTKIFEGDIVRKQIFGKLNSKYASEKDIKDYKKYLIEKRGCIFDDEENYHSNYNYIVEWKLNGFYPFADSPENCRHCGGAEDNEQCEIIGNIYDNPELLKGVESC